MSSWKVAVETGRGCGASEGVTSPEFSTFPKATHTSPQWNSYGSSHREFWSEMFAEVWLKLLIGVGLPPLFSRGEKYGKC